MSNGTNQHFSLIVFPLFFGCIHSKRKMKEKIKVEQRSEHSSLIERNALASCSEWSEPSLLETIGATKVTKLRMETTDFIVAVVDAEQKRKNSTKQSTLFIHIECYISFRRFIITAKKKSKLWFASVRHMLRFQNHKYAIKRRRRFRRQNVIALARTKAKPNEDDEWAKKKRHENIVWLCFVGDGVIGTNFHIHIVMSLLYSRSWVDSSRALFRPFPIENVHFIKLFQLEINVSFHLFRSNFLCHFSRFTRQNHKSTTTFIRRQKQ